MSGFDQVDAAIEAKLNGDASANDGSTAEENNETRNQTEGLSPNEQQTIQQLLELDKQERFKFEGKEWTPSELKEAILRQSDYTKKTMELAQERKYTDNLSADLRFLSRNPQAVSQFKSVYPEKYHQFADEILEVTKASTASGAPTPQPSSSYASIDPTVLEDFNKLKKTVTELHSGWSTLQKEKTAAQIDNVMNTMTKKYPSADERTVLATAQTLRADGMELTEQVWEKIFKQEHDRLEGMWKNRREKEIKEQLEANKKGRDVGGGGGVPGQAPKKMKSFKDAEEAAIAAFSRS